MSLRLKNPHSVLAALETRPNEVKQIQLARLARENESANDPWAQVAKLARKHGIPVQQADRPPRGERGGGDGREGLTEALVEARQGISAEELFSEAKNRAGGKGIWLALDCLQDPQNIGAIFRAAAFFGVQGILLTEERSAPLSGTAYDVASGGVEYVPFTMQTNLQRAFEIAKDRGLWILGTSEHAKDDFHRIEADRPWLVVLGSEEKGMRRLTQESCDVLCQIPPRAGGVTSLNVSVAAGILMSGLTR